MYAFQMLECLAHEARVPLGQRPSASAPVPVAASGRRPVDASGRRPVAADASNQAQSSATEDIVEISDTEDLSETSSTTLRQLLPPELARRMPEGGLADRPMICREGMTRAQMMYAQWFALHVINDLASETQAAHHDFGYLSQGIDWLQGPGDVLTSMSECRALRWLNKIANEAKHDPPGSARIARMLQETANNTGEQAWNDSGTDRKRKASDQHSCLR